MPSDDGWCSSRRRAIPRARCGYDGGEVSKAKLLAVAGILVGGVGLGVAIWGGNRWGVAFSGVMYGSTLTLCAWVLMRAR